jgi:hypothetical protein
MKQALVIVGIAIIAAAIGWKVAIAPRYEVRFPDTWKWTLTTFGTNLYADEQGKFPDSKKFPADDDVSVSDRTITVSRGSAPDQVSLDDHYLAKDPNTGAVTWDFTYHAKVDPITGQYADATYKGDYYFFPRNVQKGETYRVRNTSYPGLPITFQQETTVNGLAVYEFAYMGDYDNSAAYPDTKLQPGQTIKCTNMDLRYWVEPLTGEVVKYSEHCNADAIVDSASGKAVSYLSRWSGETKSDSIIARVNEVSAQRTGYLLATSYGPLLLGVLGVVLAGAGLFLMSRPAPIVNSSAA